MKRLKDYALYKGDEFVDLGTIKHLSKKYHIAEKTLRYYAMPRWKKPSGQKWIYSNKNRGGEYE